MFFCVSHWCLVALVFVRVHKIRTPNILGLSGKCPTLFIKVHQPITTLKSLICVRRWFVFVFVIFRELYIVAIPDPGFNHCLCSSDKYVILLMKNDLYWTQYIYIYIYISPLSFKSEFVGFNPATQCLILLFPYWLLIVIRHFLHESILHLNSTTTNSKDKRLTVYLCVFLVSLQKILFSYI